MALYLSALVQGLAAVSATELADYLGVEDTDPLLPGLALAATDAASQFLQRSITVTQYRAEWDSWPSIGGYNPRSLSRSLSVPRAFIELPMTGPLVSVQSVELDDVAVIDYRMSGGNPSRLSFTPADGPIVVEYTAGWATPPAWAVQAVLCLAAYMFEHRGQCDADQALIKSGAATMLQPHRVVVV